MELTLKTELKIGQKLYYADSKTKNVYAPCDVCGNERKIDIEVSGQEFRIDCPKCTGKQIKGNESNGITVNEYFVCEYLIESFVCEDGKSFIVKIGYDKAYIDSLLEISRYMTIAPKQYYIDKSECLKVVKAKNKESRAKVNEFLGKVKATE